MLGGLDFGPPDAVAPVAAGLAAADVTFELLGPRDAEARWPGLRLDGDVLFHPQAGTVDAAGAVDAFVRLASRAGAEVRWSTEVSSLSPRGDGALLRFASGQSLTARHVVVAAGAWVAALLPGLPALPPLTVTQQQTFHFARADPAQPPWPSVIHRDFGRAGGGVYHLAGGRDGGPADDRKIGEHEGGHTASARERDGIVDAASRARVVEYVQSLAARAVFDAQRRDDMFVHLDPERGLRPRPGRPGGGVLAVLGPRREVRPAHRRVGRRSGDRARRSSGAVRAARPCPGRGGEDVALSHGATSGGHAAGDQRAQAVGVEQVRRPHGLRGRLRNGTRPGPGAPGRRGCR
jgi:hypothetical protein